MSVVRDADIIIAVSGMTLSLISLIRLFTLSYLEKEIRRFFLIVNFKTYFTNNSK